MSRTTRDIAVTMIDEIEELRAELRHCHLTATERRDAEARLAELLRARKAVPCDHENCSHDGFRPARSLE
ncbi:MAG: hypothetical protein ABS35_16625 [Kaistia sp. SCN 65-12]|nr:MAG: hypothetical protein ABS35_16625 [Kaistia sp. SCN 65-12]